MMAEKRKVVFISGPMTGLPDFNRAAFNAEAERLTALGFIVLNPAVFPDGLAHGQYMAMCLPMVEQADTIMMLAGWESSKGAVMEFNHAKELQLPIIYQSAAAEVKCG